MTLGALYVFFTLLSFGIELSTAMVLGILLLTHVASWGIIGIMMTINMSSACSVTALACEGGPIRLHDVHYCIHDHLDPDDKLAVFII